MGKDEDYRQLYAELEAYERKDIPINMDGYPASPLQIVRAHMIKENHNYMRDYDIDDNGRITKINFIKLTGK